MSSRRIIKVVETIRRLEEIRDDVIQHMGEEGWNGSDAERQLEEAYEEYHFLITPTERKGGKKLKRKLKGGTILEADRSIARLMVKLNAIYPDLFIPDVGTLNKILEGVVEKNPYTEYRKGLMEKSAGRVLPMADDVVIAGWTKKIEDAVKATIEPYKKTVIVNDAYKGLEPMNVVPDRFRAGLDASKPKLPEDPLDRAIYLATYFPNVDNPDADKKMISDAFDKKYPRPRGVEVPPKPADKGFGKRHKKGGARTGERGIAGFLRERFYFGEAGSPAYPIRQYLSAVIHSPNTQPMPKHPFKILLEGNEATAVSALQEILNDYGWTAYVKDNSKWGKEPQGYAVVPTVATRPPKAPKAPAPANAPPSEGWATPKPRPPKPERDPMAVMFGEAEPEEEEADEGDEGLAQAVEESLEVAEPVVEPSKPNEPPKPKGKPAPKEEVDLDAERERSKQEFFKEVEKAYTDKPEGGKSYLELNTILVSNTEFSAKKQREAMAGAKRVRVLKGIVEKMREDYNTKGAELKALVEEGARRVIPYNKELELLNKLEGYSGTEYMKKKEEMEAEQEAIENIRTRAEILKSELATDKQRYLEMEQRGITANEAVEKLDDEGEEATRKANEAVQLMKRHPFRRVQQILSDKGWEQEFGEYFNRTRGKGRYRGRGAIPTNNILQKIAVQSYKPNADRVVGDFTLFRATPTLKFYKQGNTVVVGIRGTVPTDIEDVKADGLIALNKLEGSPRFQRDEAELRSVKGSMPNFDFYGVGHSLGGAVLDGLLNKNLLISGVSYNPAVQPKDFNSNVPNRRIYQKGDPLYALGKNFLKNAPEVREAKPKSWKDRLISLVPYAGSVYDYLDAHNLSNFEGGGKSAKRPTPLNPLSREEYLSRVRAKAKSEGYPHKLLGYADDGKHKFQIPNPDGKIIRFGRAGYGDFHIWSALEASGKVAKGYADGKRKAFQNSHNKIKGRWRSDLFSPNNLALKILW